MRQPTIHEALKTKLGREPSHTETVAEVRRILQEATERTMIVRAGAGKLPHQRKRR